MRPSWKPVVNNCRSQRIEIKFYITLHATRRVVESQRCSSTPAHVHLQPNHYRLRPRRARRQIVSYLL